MTTAVWNSVCTLEDLVDDVGACAYIDGRQVAVFRITAGAVHAIDNYDPAGKANVLSRGIVGDIAGEPVVASPLYKHHYSLVSGQCCEDPQYGVSVYPVRVMDGQVWVRSAPQQVRKQGRRKLVVVGNGMAAMRTVEELLEIAPQAYDITVFGAEPRGNYNRILLSPLLAGDKQAAEILLHPLDWYRARNIALHAGDPVVRIDRRARTVTSRSGVVASYDRLLLATGSRPFIPETKGKEIAGIMTFRDLDDVDAMLSAARDFQDAVVVGGGLLGLEAAYGLQKRGMQVTVVHLQSTLMERQLDATASGLLRNSLEQRGITFCMPAKTVAFEGESRVKWVHLADGTWLRADIVVIAAGILPNTTLALECGLRCDRGILVDDTLQTFDPSIYAVGECVQHRNRTYGLVAPLWEQARVCARHLAEVGVSHYAGSPVSTHLKVAGVAVFSAGDIGPIENSESLIYKDLKRGIYKRLVVVGDRLRAAILYGDTQDGAWYHDLIHEGREVASMRHQLLFGQAATLASAS